jgi:hypothetical protein
MAEPGAWTPARSFATEGTSHFGYRHERYRVVGQRLRLIPGGADAAPKRKRHPWAGCNVCEGDIGVRSKALTTVTTNPEVDARGNIVGGTRVKVCAICLARGKFTPHTI